MNGFQANPEGLMQMGKNLTSIYEGYGVQMDNVYKTSDKIANLWAGADGAGYISAMHSYKEDFDKLGVVLAQLADIVYRHGSRLAGSRDAIRNAASRL